MMSFDHDALLMASVKYLKNTNLSVYTPSKPTGVAIKRVKTQTFCSELSKQQPLICSSQLKKPVLNSPILPENYQITSSQTQNDYLTFPSNNEQPETNVPVCDYLKFFQIQQEGNQKKVDLLQRKMLIENVICFLVEQQRKILRELIINNNQRMQHMKTIKNDSNLLLTKKPIFKVTRNLVQQKNLKKVEKSSNHVRDEFVKEIKACDIHQENKTFEFSSFKLNLAIKTKDGSVKTEA